MKKIIIVFLLFLHFSAAKADKILRDIDFSSGEWVMVGVPLHNYQFLPVQEEMGTFICKDVNFMKDIQKNWDFEYTNEDKCDYHYSIKFYKNKDLAQTMTLNLHCGYITYDGLSYAFDPTLFNRFKAVSKPVDWSRINFENDDMLKKAVATLSKTSDVYWYEDVKQYQYKGYLNLAYSNLPWDVNQDSLKAAVENAIKEKTGAKDFYIQQKGYTVNGDFLYMSYQVSCDENVAKKIAKFPNAVTKWKAHIEKGEVVHVVAIGINESKYRKIMGI